MKVVLKALAEQGIKRRLTAPGKYDIDCPKEYCKEARGDTDRECLALNIITPQYAEFKCRHCLWTGHAGEKPAFTLAPQKDIPEITASSPNSFYGLAQVALHSEPIIAHRKEDATLLRNCGLENVMALPDSFAGARDRGDKYAPEEDKFSYLAEAATLLNGCSKITLAFDNTPAGLALKTEIARRIGPGKCWVVNFSHITAKETFDKAGSDGLCADIHEASRLPIRGLYEITEFEKELVTYFEEGMAAGVSTGWENVDKLYTVVPGQLTLVTGIPNSGKSEWVDALSINLAINHGWKFAAFSPENGKAAHATKLIEKRVELSSDPRSKDRMSFETFASGMAWVQQNYYFIESTEIMPTLDWILERAADAVLRYGIKGLIIDPWNRIEKKLENFRSETDYVAAALPRILRFLHNHNVHGWLIVHPRSQEPDRKTGKLRPPSLYDMAGSAHFVNMCDNGIVVHRSESIDDTTEVHVKKVRFKHVGTRGVTKLSYNMVSGRYFPLDKSPEYLYGAADTTNNIADDGIKSWDPEA